MYDQISFVEASSRPLHRTTTTRSHGSSHFPDGQPASYGDAGSLWEGPYSAVWTLCKHPCQVAKGLVNAAGDGGQFTQPCNVHVARSKHTPLKRHPYAEAEGVGYLQASLLSLGDRSPRNRKSCSMKPSLVSGTKSLFGTLVGTKLYSRRQLCTCVFVAVPISTSIFLNQY